MLHSCDQTRVYVDDNKKDLPEFVADTLVVSEDDDDDADGNNQSSDSCSNEETKKHQRRKFKMSLSVPSYSNDGFECVNEYALLSTIGVGSCGKVMLALNTKTNETFAIKIIPKKYLVANKGISYEVAIMKRLRHRHIVALYEAIDAVDENCLYLVMQYIDGGPIVKLDRHGQCEPLSEYLVKKYFRQLISGLSYLKRHRIVHRDIKPDNIMIDKYSN